MDGGLSCECSTTTRGCLGMTPAPILSGWRSRPPAFRGTADHSREAPTPAQRRPAQLNIGPQVGTKTVGSIRAEHRNLRIPCPQESNPLGLAACLHTRMRRDAAEADKRTPRRCAADGSRRSAREARLSAASMFVNARPPRRSMNDIADTASSSADARGLGMMDWRSRHRSETC